jgi:exosortase/archaeosortase family protein
MKTLTKKNVIFVVGVIFLVFWIWKLFLASLVLPIYTSYLHFIATIAVHFLNYYGTKVDIRGNTIIIDQSLKFILTVSLLSKTWVLLILGIIWITPGTNKQKCFYSVIPFLIHVFSSILSICFLILFLRNGNDSNDAQLMAKTVVSDCFKLFLFIWIYKQRGKIIGKISGIGLNKFFFILVGKNLLVLLLLTLVINNFFIAFFQFDWLVWFLFNSSAKILHLVGYEAIVNGRYLIGNNGNIYMDKYCMGIWLMFYFAAFIIITGSKIQPRLWYIVIGIIVINLINVMRFVFLFIHLQEHGDYVLAINFHDLFNYAVYIFIFIAWIVWIEGFSDIWEYLKLGENI